MAYISAKEFAIDVAAAAIGVGVAKLTEKACVKGYEAWKAHKAKKSEPKVEEKSAASAKAEEPKQEPAKGKGKAEAKAEAKQ